VASTDSRPVPRKNTAFRFYFAIRKNDGTLITTWTGMDSEVSLDGAAFSDCTNEATEIGTSGVGYIDFTSGEMNADAVCYKLTVTNTSALPLVVTFFPEEVGDYRADVVQISGDTTAADNLELAADGTGYNLGGGSIVAASVTGAVASVTGAVASVTGAVGSVTGAVGSVTGNVGGNVTGSVGSVATGGITAASFAADAITAAKIAADVTTEIQAGLATASSITALDGKIDTIDSNVDAILVDTAEIGTAGAGLTNINLPNQTMDIVGNITGNLSGSVGSVTGAVGSVTGAVGSVTGLTASDVGAIKAETDKLADTLEDDAGTYRFTTNALEQAPAGGGGGTTDWTADERTSIRSILGIPGSGTTPADPTTGILDTIRDAVVVVDDLIDTELAAVKTDTAAIKLKTDNLPSDPADQSAVEAAITAAQLTAAGVRSAVGLASANLDTQLADLPTNAELTTALGTADDAVLAAIAALNNLSAAQVASALNTYDAPTKAEFDAAVALLATAANLALVPAAVLTAADANPIAANAKEINDTTLTGDGGLTTPWGATA
jgi:hypothetical protein